MPFESDEGVAFEELVRVQFSHRGAGFKEDQVRRFPQNLADPTARFQLMQGRRLLPGVCLSGWPCKSYGFLRENATSQSRFWRLERNNSHPCDYSPGCVRIHSIFSPDKSPEHGQLDLDGFYELSQSRSHRNHP